ncbi:hypothetical protein BC941DRAFT_508747 [Chlamydoabsidia padenii]|nr:hypothetical protein BC941DRAFT_508747 [Chlamydoabsidia padenii]
MSATGSTSSRGTHSRSPSRSRSPPYSDGRYPPRYSSRYDSYGYRPRSNMTAAIDDYWELRDRERERERDRSLMMRDERYGRGRYTHYYRDEPLAPHHYGPPNISRDFNKPSSSTSTSLRRENSIERQSTLPTKAKDDINIGNSNSNKPPPPILTDAYASRYADWRDREWDRERDRRYRDDDRRREFDRRNRERDGYSIRDSRYDSAGYAAGPPTSGYPPPPFGGDSYRPSGRDREPPSSPVAPHPYYDRDNRERFEDRDFYRPVSRGSSIEFDRYRNRPPRSATERPTSSWRAASRERESTISAQAKSTTTYGTTGPTSSSSSTSTTTTKDDNKSSDTKLMDDDTEEDATEPKSAQSLPANEDKVEEQKSIATTSVDQPVPPDTKTANVETKSGDVFKLVGKDDNDETVERQQQNENDNTRSKGNNLHIDVSLSTNWDNDSMDVDAPTPSSSSPPLSSRSTVSLVLPQSSSTSSEAVITQPTSVLPPSSASDIAVSAKTSTPSTSNPPAPSPPLKQEHFLKESVLSSTSTNVKTDSDTFASKSSNISQNGPTDETASSSLTDDKLTTETHKPSEPIMSQQQIVARIGDIENDITMYEDMLEEINKREILAKQQQEQQEEEKRQRQEQLQQQQQSLQEGDSLSDTRDDDDDMEEEAAKKQALQVISQGTQPMTDIQNTPFNDSPIMRRRRPQLLMDQIRTNDDAIDEALSEVILADNQRLAKENSQMINGWQGKPDDGTEWNDENKWSAPLYKNLEDYPCYKENIKTYNNLRVPMAAYLTSRHKILKQKERWLKREFKDIYIQWKNKNMALDRMRDQERRGSDRFGGSGGGYRSSTRRGRGVEDEPEEYVDGVIFTGNHDALRFSTDGASTPFGRGRGGAWTSDAARSEAELLEIIQSLESAEMRNPEMRAKKTTATIPPMILDVKERMRTYDDRSGLVENPLVYYHTGAETEDIWTQQEMTAFMESYMQYPKQFEKISAAVRTKTASQCVLFYYRKKTKIDFKALMRKGKRGKNRRRERLAAAIKRATGDTSTNARKGKSKGSALMADIGQAQVSRKAKEKESETKTKELRELEEANAYWESVAERRKSKRPSSTSSVASRTTTLGNDDPGTPGYGDPGTKKKLGGKRKGRSPRPSVTSMSDAGLVFPDDSSSMDDTKSTAPIKSLKQLSPSQPQSQQRQVAASTTDGYFDDLVKGGLDQNDSTNSTTAKWTDKDKNAAVEAFKVLGRDFIKVSQKVATKTDDQCRNFYFNHKRKYGPNAFGEEGSDHSGTPDTISSPISTNTPAISETLPSHNSMMANGRTDLKAEEQDAAAALVGLFQMGGNRDYIIDTTLSESPSPSLSSPSTSLMTSTQHPTSLQPKGRRRARTASGKMDSTTTEQWASDDSRGINTAITGKRPSSEVKRGSSSSYWSVSERGEFLRYLEVFGRDWTKIATYMKTKTAIQVRNFYQNNEEKMQLDKVVHRREGIQPAPSASSYGNHNKLDQPLPQQQIMPPMGTSFDNHVSSSSSSSSSSQHPLHTSSIPTSYGKQPVDSPSYHPLPPGPRVGYFNSSSSTRSTQATPREYQPYGTTTTYSTLYNRPMEPRRPTDLLNTDATTSTSGVTRVSDLLNSNDEPAETNNQNSWETWFGA